MCGIFGIITPKPKKLDTKAFCVLGVNNDTRGGDSCGIFIDKKYEYGVNEFKLFYNFFPRSKVLSSVTNCQIALGHCRKASVGAINAANAQPVVIKNTNGEVEFVLIHNGTIINYLELAAKYIPNIDVKGMTDSQIMAHIFYHTGYDVLGEYIGAGAFAMVDYRSGDPEVFFFKGSSKMYKYGTTTQIERPLFCTYDNTEFIFSSTLDYLRALRSNREVLTLQANALIQLKEGNLYTIKEYDRTKLWQSRSYGSTYGTYYYSPGTDNVCSDYTNSSKYSSSQSDTKIKYYWDDVVDMDENGIYMIGRNRAHGIYWVDALGNIEYKKIKGTRQVAFWKGVLLKNVSCYSFLAKFAKDMGSTHEELLMALPDLVHYLSPCVCWKNYDGQWVISDSPNTHFLYSGVATFPFTTDEFTFSTGRIRTINRGKITYREALEDLLLTSNYKVDYDAISSFL